VRENYHRKERNSSHGLDSIHERVLDKKLKAVTTIADRGFQTLRVDKLSSSDQENNRHTRAPHAPCEALLFLCQPNSASCFVVDSATDQHIGKFGPSEGLVPFP
jgi:hypothetical protein